MRRSCEDLAPVRSRRGGGKDAVPQQRERGAGQEPSADQVSATLGVRKKLRGEPEVPGWGLRIPDHVKHASYLRGVPLIRGLGRGERGSSKGRRRAI